MDIFDLHAGTISNSKLDARADAQLFKQLFFFHSKPFSQIHLLLYGNDAINRLVNGLATPILVIM